MLLLRSEQRGPEHEDLRKRVAEARQLAEANGFESAVLRLMPGYFTHSWKVDEQGTVCQVKANEEIEFLSTTAKSLALGLLGCILRCLACLDSQEGRPPLDLIEGA